MIAKPKKLVTDARLTECLAAGGGECPFCGDSDPELLGSDYEGDVTIERWACRKCDRGWNEIFALSQVSVSAEDAAEGETGYSKPLPAPLPPEVKKLADVAEALLSAENGQDRSDALDALVDAEAAVRNLLPKETK